MRMKLVIVSFLSIGMCFGTPTRSSIGAVHSQFAQDGETFDIPYVTEGLVAIWDAEWNAGWGKHDPSGGLVELVSKIPTYVRRGTYSVESDCLKCDNVEIVSPPIPAIVSMAGGDITIEGVCTRTARGIVLGNNRPFFANNGSGFYWSNNNYYMVHVGLIEDSSGFASKWASGFNPDIRRARTLVADAQRVQWWLNGVADTYAQRTRELITTENHFSIYGWAWDFGFLESGEFCCLRIYNRALTAEEIEWNFSVDKVRFSLP